jgi:hypothetical protein
VRNSDIVPTKEQMIRMREARMGSTSIAKAAGCHESTIRYWLKKYGLVTKRVPPHRPTDEQVDAWIMRFRGHKGIKRAAE